MNITKILLTTLMLFSFSQAKHTFKTYDDMCENIEAQECLNDLNQVKNLQIALNADKNLNLNLKTDGKWGDNTKAAVVKFQEYHKLTPVAGFLKLKKLYVLNLTKVLSLTAVIQTLKKEQI